MRKLPSVSLDERPRTRRRRATAILVVFLLLIISPVAYESVRLCYANWKSLFGTYTTVDTPVLNYLSDNVGQTSHEFRSWYRGLFHRTPWRSSYVIPFAIFWTTVLALLLRKG